MGRLLRAAASQQALLDAWDTVRESAYESGSPSDEVKHFEAAIARHVARISTALIAGEWQPSPAHAVDIRKPKGGIRKLAIPSVEDRMVERALLTVVDAEIDPLLLPWSFAYRRGLGVDDAIRELVAARDRGLQWVVRCDIDDCFDAIPRFEVLRKLAEVVDDRELVALVGAIIKRPVVGRRTGAGQRGRGLVQGSPLSPVLANLYLDGFDRALLNAGQQVIRYADDIALPVRDRGAGEAALDLAAQAIGGLRLELNVGKSRIESFDEGVEFLGRTITASTGAGVAETSHPLETTVYVSHQGALIRSKGDRIVVTHSDETLLRVSYRRVRQVVTFGRVGMSTPFLHQAMKRGIEVTLLDEHGACSGTFAPQYRSDVQARRAQYRTTQGSSAALDIAKEIVIGKVQNQRVLLLRLDRLVEPELGPHIRRIDKARTQVDAASSVTALMGLEGSAARDYFAALSMVFAAEWGFTGRNRQPPRDPLNAMLSFGYTLLTNEGLGAVTAAGLDPYVGLLHVGRSGAPALALDLIEEFRPLIVDQVSTGLLRTGRLRRDEFIDDEGAGCRMDDAARVVFLEGYERRMLTLVTHGGSGRRVSYRVALGLQARKLKECVMQDVPYRPLVWK